MHTIRPIIGMWCHKILPLVYDDSLSYYELLCKVIEKVNEVIKNDEELVKEWERWQADIDGIVRKEVDKWLEEHPEATTTVEDGAVTMAKLAPDTLRNMWKDGGEINPKMVGRFRGIPSDYSYAQDICNDGSYYYISCSNANSTGGCVVKMSMDGQFVKKIDVPNTGHPKICFDRKLNRVIVAPNYYAGSWALQYMFVIDSNLTNVVTVNLGENAPNAISNLGNKMYALRGASIYEFTCDSNNVFTFTRIGNAWGRIGDLEGFACDGAMVYYYCARPSALYITDLNGQVFRTYGLTGVTDRYKTGEPQAVLLSEHFTGGVVMMNTIHNNYCADTLLNVLMWNGNIVDSDDLVYNYNNTVVYDSHGIHFNPIGTYDVPLTSLQMACDKVLYSDYAFSTIVVAGDGNTDGAVLGNAGYVISFNNAGAVNNLTFEMHEGTVLRIYGTGTVNLTLHGNGGKLIVNHANIVACDCKWCDLEIGDDVTIAEGCTFTDCVIHTYGSAIINDASAMVYYGNAVNVDRCNYSKRFGNFVDNSTKPVIGAEYNITVPFGKYVKMFVRTGTTHPVVIPIDVTRILSASVVTSGSVTYNNDVYTARVRATADNAGNVVLVLEGVSTTGAYDCSGAFVSSVLICD